MQTWQKDAKLPELVKRIEAVSESQKSCERWQDRLSRFCPYWAVFSACLGTLIIYFDWIDIVGWACGFLILPFPVYWGIATLRYRMCRRVCEREYATFLTLIVLVPDLQVLADSLLKNGAQKDMPAPTQA